MHLVPSTQGHPHPTWVFFGDPRSNGFPCSESSLASAYNNSHGDYKVISKSCIASKMWKMSALLVFCPKDIKEQMFLRMDEIGENYEVLREKVLS